MTMKRLITNPFTIGALILGLAVLFIPALQNRIIGVWNNLHITQAASAAVGCSGSDSDRGRHHSGRRHSRDDIDAETSDGDDLRDRLHRRERERMRREMEQRDDSETAWPEGDTEAKPSRRWPVPSGADGRPLPDRRNELWHCDRDGRHCTRASADEGRR
jgi:hypothetical protein